MRTRNLLISLAALASVGATSLVASAAIDRGDFESGAVATQEAERLRPPVNLTPDRPRVFMAFHGTNVLANNSSLDPQWSYVRQNLDGLWGNNAAISGDEIVRLVNKVDTRQLVTESFHQNSSFFVETYDYVERRDPRIDFEREAITFYSDQPGIWNGKTIADARAAVERADYGTGDDPYTGVYTGWQPQNFYPNGEGSRPPIRSGSSAERALLEGDGVFVECPNDVCNGVVYEDGFFRAMRTARQTGQKFVWLASRPPGSPQSGWLAEFQTMYNRVSAEGLWRPGDIIVVIAYNGQYPTVPEAVGNGNAADTTTGLMYWALNQ